MAMDMPPAAPAYAIERAAPATSPMMRAVSAARNAVLTRPGSVTDHDTVERIMPRIDVRSAALTREDRTAMVASAEASRAGALGNARVSIPDSYVGQRIKLAIANDRLHEAQGRGDLDPAMARDVSCRMVAIAMDARAGAYVMGGEKAAAQARAAVPAEMLARCRQTAMAETAQREGVCTTDSRAPSRVAARVRIDPVQSRRVSIDPAGSKRVSIDPTPSKKVSIDPTPSRKVSISPSMAAARAAASGRSI
jgi:hypothetical protein